MDYSVVANFATTAKDGKIYDVEYYNLDVIAEEAYKDHIMIMAQKCSFL